jgi:dipeptidyl-peptidase-3
MEQYLTPKEQPIFSLKCENAFKSLTLKEKKYAHFISQACFAGSPIILYQTSLESPVIFTIFQKLFSGDSIEKMEKESIKKGITKEEFNDFLQYVTCFYGNMGNYKSFGDTKFIPRISKEKFELILQCSSNLEFKKDILNLFEKYKDKIYSCTKKELSLGLEENGISTYYSENITRADIKIVREFMQQKNLSPYNTRLWKLDNNLFEIKIASVFIKPKETYIFKDYIIYITYGDHQKFLSDVVKYLEEAIPYSANEIQKNMLKKYINSFNNGSIEDHKDSQRFWIKDMSPIVECNLGFIESYRDPEGERGEWEGFVAIVNKEMSEKFANLVKNAEKFIELLPWGKSFEKDKFLKPDFTSLEVLTFSTSGIPSGINIPNYDDIRQTEGFKNVSLGNVLSATSPTKPTFIRDEEIELYQQYETKSFEVQVAIHELLGHGTGKLFSQNEKGEFNFSLDLIHPFTNTKINSYYKLGETWDSKFLSYASTMEECRAECCGLYLCTNPELLSIFGYKDPIIQKNVYYINWLMMIRNGIRALEFYNPETKKWGQAHMQARFAIFHALLKAGNELIYIQKEKDNALIFLDREKIPTIGLKVIGEFLYKLQVYKSTADVENGIKFYQEYCSVTDEFNELREIAILKKEPRKVFIQPLTKMEDNGDINYIEYPNTTYGMIQSFIDRFGIVNF